jgi:hypothetical protein
MKLRQVVPVLGVLSLMLCLTVPAMAQNGYPGQQPMGAPQINGVPVMEPPVFMQTDKPEYGQNEVIKVKFKALPSFQHGAWIGMLDAGYPHGDGNENDKHDLTYQYLQSKLRGELVFNAPKIPGEYDFRINDNGKEYYAVPFRVVEKSFVHEMPGVNLTLDKKVYRPNENVVLTFQSAPDISSGAWVGILAANYPHGDAGENDKHDLAYQYLSSRLNGQFTFKAPANTGNYDFRLNDNGREYFYVPFTVSTTPVKPAAKGKSL